MFKPLVNLSAITKRSTTHLRRALYKQQTSSFTSPLFNPTLRTPVLATISAQTQTRRFTASAIQSKMVARVQHPAPNFKGIAVVDGEFKDISLDDYKGKWLVLAFIPMAWTFVCPTEINAYSDAVPQFASRDASIIFASVDSEYSLLSWANAARKDGGLGGVKFPLFSDKNHKLAIDYGVLIEERGIALRGLFVIDPTGTIRQITINDLPVGRSVDETLRLIDAFQFTEKYGEVCPANWTPGAATMKGDPKNSKEYFTKVHG